MKTAIVIVTIAGLLLLTEATKWTSRGWGRNKQSMQPFRQALKKVDSVVHMNGIAEQDKERHFHAMQSLPSGCDTTTVYSQLSDLQSSGCAALGGSGSGSSIPTLDQLRAQSKEECSVCAPLLEQKKCALAYLDALAGGMYSDMIKLFCAKDQNGEYCGTVIQVFGQEDCSNHYSTECNQVPYCHWDTENYQCVQIDMPVDILKLSCSNCLQSVAEWIISQQSAFSSFLSSGSGSMSMGEKVQFELDIAIYLQAQSVQCTMVDGQFCYAGQGFLRLDNLFLGDTNNGPIPFLNATALAADCTDSFSRRCSNKVARGMAQTARLAAYAQYDSCLTYNYEDYCFQYYYLPGYNQASMIDNFVDHVCDKNDKGDYCMALPAKSLTSSDDRDCLDYVLVEGYYCYGSCSSPLTTAVNSWGCCAGSLQAAFGVPADPPSVTAPPTTVQTSGFILNIYDCSDWTGNETAVATTMCAGVSTVTSVQRDLGIQIAWDVISNNATLQAMITDALIQDLAGRLGVSPRAIKNAVLSEDSSTTVTTSSKRRFSAQASSPGTKVTFDITGTSADDVNAAATDFDSQVSSGDGIPLPTTAIVLSNECTNCAGDLSQLVPNTNTVSSGVGSVVIATLCVLLAIATML